MGSSFKDLKKIIGTIKKAIETSELVLSEDILDLDNVTKIEITKINENNKIYLEKLEKEIIEVAIVGLENSGKSYFANSLIKVKEAFPTGPSRCTFTSTELKYSIEDKGVVEFFTKQEFNEQFKVMLNKVLYSSENTTFETIDLANYKKHFAGLEHSNEAVYKSYNSTINEDIKDIIEGKKVISELLDSPRQIFSAEQIKEKSLKEFITDKHKARTVKKVHIGSTSLANTQNIVIYDVPGFNSMTDKHKEETKNSLKRADAIILIKNTNANPEISSEEKNMFAHYDDDGVKLSEKMFVFGTQIDKLNTKDEAANNKEKFFADIKQKLDIKDGRFFLGSPFAYMQKINLEEGDSAIRRMEEFGLGEHINSVNDIKEAIENFYKNEAYEHFDRRIKRNIGALKKTLESICISIDGNRVDYVQMTAETVLRIKANASEIIEKELSLLSDSLKNDFSGKKYFTEGLRLRSEELNLEITEDYLDGVLRQLDTSVTTEFQPTKVNTKVREDLVVKLHSKYEEIICSLGNEKSREYDEKINTILLKAFGITPENSFFEELQQELSSFIGRKTDKISYSEKSFIYLIERFSRDVFDIMIGYTVGSQDRKNKFIEAKKDFIALSLYSADKVSDSVYERSFIKALLGVNSSICISQQIKDTLMQNGFELLTKHPQFGVLAKLFLKASKSDLLEKIKEIVAGKLTDSNLQNAFEKLQNGFGNLEDTDSGLEFLLDTCKQAKSKQELVGELNSDIKNLIEILQSNVIEATGLEKPFLSSMTKKIHKIKNMASRDQDFESFLIENLKKIKFQDFADFDSMESERIRKKELANKIKTLIEEIN